MESAGAPAHTAQGASPSWVAQKSNAVRIWNDGFMPWLAPKAPAIAELQNNNWNGLSEHLLCDPDIYRHFGYYLTDVYTIADRVRNAGLPLSAGTVQSVWGIMVNKASVKFKTNGSAESKLFLTCLDGGSGDSATWLKKIKNKMERVCFQRAMQSGAEMDCKAKPLYLLHLRLLSRALAREGSAQSALRKWAFTAHRYMAGRSAELAWITLAELEWDFHYATLIGTVPMSKPSAFKKAAFCAGADEYCCFLTAFGDHLTLNIWPLGEDGEEAKWLFPTLRDSDSPGTMLGRWYAAMQPRDRGGAAQYADFCVPELPVGVSAAGVRRGVANELESAVDAYRAVVTTGHAIKLKGESAFFDYLEASTARLSAGAVVISGLPPLPWGQSGKMPVPARV